MQLEITDNAYRDHQEGWTLEQCASNLLLSVDQQCQISYDLNIIGNKSIAKIVEDNPDLLVFPHMLGQYRDGIEDLRICWYNSATNRLCTGNIMGFVGVNDTQLTIRSRFARHGEDYFLHYMLMQVFCPNVFKFHHETNFESVFDFLIYMFPHFFNKAMQQGLFKMYRRFEHNDIKVKGQIDIPRHINSNMPLQGRIAYNTREYSFDNNLTQIIRHTIEFIKRTPYGSAILRERATQSNIQKIIDVTPSYLKSNLTKILFENRKKLNHPYYTNYIPLQKLCWHILQRKKLKYGSNQDKIYGILFDGAWLWEEFLNSIFKGWGLIHAENKSYKNPIYLFENNLYSRYPDFYCYNETVIDAKYKRQATKEIARDDIHQIITYLHILNAHSAYIAFPKDNGKTSIEFIGNLKGMKGKIGKIALHIPQTASSFSHFCELMNKEINKLKQEWNSKIITNKRF